METLTVKELLELFQKYTDRIGKDFSMICIYNDGSGRLVHMDETWNDVKNAMYNHRDAVTFEPGELGKVLAGE